MQRFDPIPAALQHYLSDAANRIPDRIEIDRGSGAARIAPNQPLQFGHWIRAAMFSPNMGVSFHSGILKNRGWSELDRTTGAHSWSSPSNCGGHPKCPDKNMLMKFN